MKHFEKKILYAGAKGGGSPPPPKPPVLTPPEVGDFKVAASYQFSETVDLISDGPIDGLCNKFGARLDNNNYLQGVYLNDAPVEESSVSEKVRYEDVEFETISNRLVDRLNFLMDTITKSAGNILEQPQRERRIELPFTFLSKYFRLTENVLKLFNFAYGADKPISFWTRYRMYSYNISQGYNDLHEVGTWNYWYRYVDNRLNYLNNPKQSSAKFFQETSPIAILDGDGIDSNIMMDFGATFARISNELFRTYEQFYLNGGCFWRTYDDSSCVSDYTEATIIKKRKSVCLRGAQELVTIIKNGLNETNVYEYKYLLNKLKLIGLSESVDENTSVSYFQDVIRNKFGVFDDDVVNDVKSPVVAGDVIPPFIAWTIKDQLNGYVQSEHENIFVQNGKIKSREFDYVLDGNFDVDWDLRSGAVLNLLIPSLDPETGKWDGTVKGFYLEKLNCKYNQAYKKWFFNRIINSNSRVRIKGDIKACSLRESSYAFYKDVTGIGVYEINTGLSRGYSKFNYMNVLCEFRDGSGTNQIPLSYFRNIYLDKEVSRTLVGPFNAGNKGRRMQALQNWTRNTIYRTDTGKIKQRSLVITDQESIENNVPGENQVPAMALSADGKLEWLIALDEGSEDVRRKDNKEFDFSNWNTYNQEFDERAQPVTHVIYNPDVQSVYFTLVIEGLYDTLHRDASRDDGKYLGAKIPSIANIRVEVGYIVPDRIDEGNDKVGEFKVVYDRFFRLAALIENVTQIDIGNPENANFITELSYIKELYKDNSGSESKYAGGVGESFELPNAVYSSNQGFEQVYRDRFIRITKLSTESNSTLIQKKISLSKVSEIIPLTFNYPYSALVGTKVDSRTFSQIPVRRYDCRLKKVKIPRNYTPLLENGRDKRFWDDARDLQAAGKTERTRIYNGDWDGEFKLGWTDNPAWILYDLLTNQRYGLGQYIEEENVNKWQLYKIGKFCDAVDEDGYFVGVKDNLTKDDGTEIGPRQPRYSCNVIFDSSTRLFDAINSVAESFRGLVYFSDSMISFSDDRIKEPVLIFNNDNVIKGAFNYSNTLRDQQYNVVEVSYLDKDDGYKPKIEYIEREDDILKRGIFKKVLNGFGITNRNQAKRLGEHFIYESTRENQTISFKTGLEGLICKPGDLIIVDDDLKSLSSNFGKVLDVDLNNKKIRISEDFDAQKYEGSVTVYIPTGNQTLENIEDILLSQRFRYEEFEMNSNNATFISRKLNGSYKFSQYISGYQDLTLGNQAQSSVDFLQNEYAFYTGETDGIKHYLWYSTLYTGWIFSTGQAFSHSATYDKYISPPSGDTNNVNIAEFEYFNDVKNGTNPWYNFTAAGNGRGTQAMSLNDSFLGLRQTAGAIDSDIKINEIKQTLEMNVLSTIQEDYGTTLQIDSNDESSLLMPIIPVGSIYRFKRKNTTDQIYKIRSIKEEDANVYTIIATAYESGKYAEIENLNYTQNINYNLPYVEDSYYKVDNSTYNTLDYPDSVQFSVSQINDPEGGTSATINGSWSKVENATGYKITMQTSFDTERTVYTTLNNNISIEDINENGQYVMTIQSLGQVFNNKDIYNHYLDSEEFYKYINISFLEDDDFSSASAPDGLTIN